MIGKTPALSLVISIIVLESVSARAQEQSDGKRLYQTYCSACHGSSGKGDGPAAKTLPVKPADHTRSAMSKHTDQYLADIISKGGASVGKTPQMPAWGGVLKENQIQEIVGYIRVLSGAKKETTGGQASVK